MEVRDQSFYGFEPVPGVNKNIRVALRRFDVTVFVGRGFEYPNRSRSDCNYPTPFLYRTIDFFRRLFVYLVILGMNFVFENVIFLNGSERSQSDVKKNFGKLNAFIFEFLYKFLRKMKSCRRCGARTANFVINRLISLLIVEFFGNIRGKRNFADSVENILENSVKLEFNRSYAVVWVASNCKSS